jgi:TonB family protein
MSMGPSTTADVIPIDASPDGEAEKDGRRAEFGASDAMATDDVRADETSAGGMLRIAREATGHTIADIAARTNVPPARLEAIERMDVAFLPSAPFTLGFVRAYANELNLPADALVARFRQEAGYPAPGAAPTIRSRRLKDMGPPKQTSLLTVLLVIGFILIVTWRIIQAAAPDEAPPLSGFPLADRANERQTVTYEVQTDLGDTTATASQPDVQAPSFRELEIGEPVEPDDQGPSAEALAAVLTAQPESPTTESAEPRTTSEILFGDMPAAIVEAEADTPETDPASDADAPQPAPRVTADDLNAQALAALRAADSAGGTTTEQNAPATGQVTGIAAPEASEQTIPAAVRLAIEPVYPARCESTAAEQEVVTVSFTVSRFGKVVNPSVANSTNSCFNSSALSAVSRWDFAPARQDGMAVESAPRTSRVVFERP